MRVSAQNACALMGSIAFRVLAVLDAYASRENATTSARTRTRTTFKYKPRIVSASGYWVHSFRIVLNGLEWVCLGVCMHYDSRSCMQLKGSAKSLAPPRLGGKNPAVV